MSIDTCSKKFFTCSGFHLKLLFVYLVRSRCYCYLPVIIFESKRHGGLYQLGSRILVPEVESYLEGFMCKVTCACSFGKFIENPPRNFKQRSFSLIAFKRDTKWHFFSLEI